MPIATTSSAWQSANEASPLHALALDFLRTHPDQAFHTRELADEVLDLGWADRVEERQHRSQDERDSSPTQAQATESMYNFVGAQALGVVLRNLVDRDEIQVKNVVVDETDNPGVIADTAQDRETVAYYAYAQNA